MRVRFCVLLSVAVILGALTFSHSVAADGVGEGPGIAREAAPVKLMHPVDGWDATDFALSFRWERQCDFEKKWTTDLYQLQVADDASFRDPVIDVVVKAPGGGDAEEGRRGDYYAEAAFMPQTLLKPGAYYWRVRVADGEGGPWSDTRRFTVNKDHLKIPLVMDISAEHPLFIFDMYMGEGLWQTIDQQWETYWGFIPDDIKPYVALDVSRAVGGSPGATNAIVSNFLDWLAPLHEAGIPITINTGTTDQSFQMACDLTELEMLFREHPNVLGVTTGENFWAFSEADWEPDGDDRAIVWTKRLIALCAKYGRILVFGDGNWQAFKWDRFFGEEPLGGELKYEWMDPDFLREHADYFVPCAKSNIIWGNFASESAILGAWLDGMITNMGMWSEAWYWNDAGYRDMFGPQFPYGRGDMGKMPPNMWNQKHLTAAARGVTVFKFGGESSTTEWGTYDAATDSFGEGGEEDGRTSDYTAMWDMYGHKTPILDRYVVPFIRAVVKHDLIPSKQEVMDEVKIAVAPAPVTADKGDAFDLGHYAPLYRATYGIREFVAREEVPSEDNEDYNAYAPTGCRYELIPNTGRYYCIPILPYPAGDIGGDAVREVSIDDLQEMSAVKSLYEISYPPRYGGDAWAVLVGDKVFVTNNHENRNIVQTFDVPLDGGGNITRIVGRAIPHAYIMGRRMDGDDAFWLQANANYKGPYTDGRTTRITFTCKQRPQIAVTPTDAAVDVTWHADRHELTLILSHESGAVEAQVRPPGGVERPGN